MKLKIGIDTGGTCTDAVLYDYENKKVIASAKALTTHEDLTIGIGNALAGLPADLLPQAEALALSTTLATNACVEDKGGRAKLIIYGAEESYVMRIIGNYGTIEKSELICIDTQTSPDGEIRRMPDWDQMRDRFHQQLGNSQAAAVVESYSRRTGARLEKKTQEILLSEMDIPVVCGYELFHELDFIKRGASSLLNARLIPVIDDFLKAVSKSAEKTGISCSPVIVRSDGTLMSKEFARLRPVETLLCGPVASVMGAGELTDTRDANAVVIDMGGTTTDISFIRDGAPVRVDGGIHIGNWNTFVKGLFVDTFALGGDTGIRYRLDRGIYLEQRRVIPMCVFASQHDYVVPELQQMVHFGESSTRSIYEYYILTKDIAFVESLDSILEDDKRICRALTERPLHMLNLCAKLRCQVYDLNTERLEAQNLIMRAGITPTDAMHVNGDYTAFNIEASRLAVQVLANCAERDAASIPDLIYDMVKERLYCNLARILLEHQFSWIKREGFSPQLDKLIRESWEQYKERSMKEAARASSVTNESLISSQGIIKGSSEIVYSSSNEGKVTGSYGKSNLLSVMLNTPYIFIGIGGPIHIFLDDVAAAFGSRAVIPDHAAVANAIGAAVCEISFVMTVHVTPTYNEFGGIIRYTVYSPGDSRDYEPQELDAALVYARERAIICAREEAVKRGLSEIPDIHLARRETYFPGLASVSDIMIDASV